MTTLRRSPVRTLATALAVAALIATLFASSARAQQPDYRITAACPAELSGGFTDVGGTHALGIDCLAWFGVAEGRTPTRFAPAAPVTRAQAASFLTRLASRLDGVTVPAGDPDVFTDIARSVHRENVQRLAAFDPPVLAGHADGTFRPDRPITRAQFAAVIARLLDHVAAQAGQLDPLPTSPGQPFADVPAGAVHADDIGRLAAAGILLGRTGDRFDPGAAIDRAQSATVLARVLGGMVEVGLAEPPAELPAPPAASARWIPAPGTTWHWQLQGSVSTAHDVAVYDIDGFDTSAATVAALAAQGKRTICYLSAGSWESWRPDADRFPSSVLGASNGWPGERWLDIRRIDVLGPIMTARMQMCADKGFDAVEPDNIDGFSNATGFALTAADQAAYNRWLAQTAHRLGLSIGLKNDVEQAALLEPSFDFAVNESCFRWDECEALEVFVRSGKAVFHVEYDRATSTFCAQANAMGFSSMRKELELGAWAEPCWN